MIKIDILTLFPEGLRAVLGESVCGRAQKAGKVAITVTDLRDFADDRHSTADDAPFGGGGGMVLKAEVVARGVEAVAGPASTRVVLDPAGELLTHRLAVELSLASHLVLVCGHYKGIDERAVEELELRPVSIGDYVLTGGEPAAWVVTDAVVRLLPGVLGDFDSAVGDSFFEDGLLGPAVYSRPAEWRGRAVPEVLVSGDHALVAKWRRESMLKRTWARRPELIHPEQLSDEERSLWEHLAKNSN
jgi:tRNA (guanine37-N1)-methyltransferase